MITVTGVRFRPAGKIYYFLPNGLKLDNGDFVIVETARGIEFGEVVIACKEVEEEETVSPVRDVVRMATEEDVVTHCDNLAKAKEAFEICAEKIKNHDLDMKLIDVEYTFDRSKVLFYFVSDNRIDFRDLVKDLAATFKTRIELRQVGIRDHARLLGGIGICGREFCCSSCMGDFQPVSIKMAKEQGLSLNPTKISGNCGKLLCCLKYEQDAYEAAMKIVPQVGAFVKTEMGCGNVVASNLLKETVSVKLDHDNETDISVFPVSEISLMNAEEIRELQKRRQQAAEKRERKKLSREAEQHKSDGEMKKNEDSEETAGLNDSGKNGDAVNFENAVSAAPADLQYDNMDIEDETENNTKSEFDIKESLTKRGEECTDDDDVSENNGAEADWCEDVGVTAAAEPEIRFANSGDADKAGNGEGKEVPYENNEKAENNPPDLQIDDKS